MNYKKVEFIFDPSQVDTEILIAILSENGYDGFWEKENGLEAYINQKLFSNKLLQSALADVELFSGIEVIASDLEDKNWNALWESNFSPVTIGGRCLIYAPFHQMEKNAEFNILIEPKMSFGTGHHQTTSLMVEQMLDIDFTNMHVLDMGSGTGVLAILASLKGAKCIDAIDNDSWAFENCQENIIRNNVKNIHALLGDASLLKNGTYDIVIANINRNIILDDIDKYVTALKPKGMLLLSGFYEKDVEIILDAATKSGLVKINQSTLENWTMLVMESGDPLQNKSNIPN